MFNFPNILALLRSVIAAKAARIPAMTVLLCALHGRICRMQTRLEMLITRWRAGTLAEPRVITTERVRGERKAPVVRFPTTKAWLTVKLGWEVAAFGGQLRHAMTEAECAKFLAECPQAGRILRPLIQMLSIDPLPEIIAKVKQAMADVGAAFVPAGVVGAVGSKKLGA